MKPTVVVMLVMFLLVPASADSLRWTTPVPIWPDTAMGDSLWQMMPSLAGVDSVLWAVWQQKRGDSPEVTCLARHDGRGWSAPDSILPLAPRDRPYFLRLALDREDDPWIVYDPYDSESGNTRLLCVRRSGDTWTCPEEIAREPRGRSMVPGLGAHPGGGMQVTLVREEGLDIRLYTLHGSGDSWTTPVMIDSAIAVMLPCEQAVTAINDSQVMVVWPASRDVEHRPLWSMVGVGDIWSEPIPVVFPPGGTELPPRIAVTRSGSVRLFWQRSGSGVQTARFNGARWVDTLQLDPEYSGGPAVCTDEYGWTWVSYFHYLESGYWRSFVRYDDGAGWSEPVAVFDTTFAVVAMAAAHGRVWVLLGRKQESSTLSLTYVSSAWHPLAVAEPEMLGPHGGAHGRPTLVRGTLFLKAGELSPSGGAALLDATGRMVMELVPGANDVLRLAPGVYFVLLRACDRSPVVRKVVIQQ